MTEAELEVGASGLALEDMEEALPNDMPVMHGADPNNCAADLPHTHAPVDEQQHGPSESPYGDAPARLLPTNADAH